MAVNAISDVCIAMNTIDVVGWRHEAITENIIRLNMSGSRMLVPFRFGIREGYDHIVRGKTERSILTPLENIRILKSTGIAVVDSSEGIYAFSLEGRNHRMCKLINDFASGLYTVVSETGVRIDNHRVWGVNERDHLTFLQEEVTNGVVSFFGYMRVYTEAGVYSGMLKDDTSTILYRVKSYEG